MPRTLCRSARGSRLAAAAWSRLCPIPDFSISFVICVAGPYQPGLAEFRVKFNSWRRLLNV